MFPAQNGLRASSYRTVLGYEKEDASGPLSFLLNSQVKHRVWAALFFEALKSRTAKRKKSKDTAKAVREER
jgi:hypothetical protein